MLTPRMPGSASGLRVTPCMTPPARPSAAPMATARTVRGMRLVAAACPRVSSEPPNAATTSDHGTSREPKATEATMTAARASTESRSHSRRTPAGRLVTASGGVRVSSVVT